MQRPPQIATLAPSLRKRPPDSLSDQYFPVRKCRISSADHSFVAWISLGIWFAISFVYSRRRLGRIRFCDGNFGALPIIVRFCGISRYFVSAMHS